MTAPRLPFRALHRPPRIEPLTVRQASTTSPRRVHWVNQYAVSPDQAGGTRHHEMATALRRRGYDVRVVASDLNLTTRSYTRRRDPDDGRALPEQVGEVPFVWLPAGTYQRNDWRRALSMAVFAWYVLSHLLGTVRRGDVVIGSSPQLLAAAAARIAALLRGGRFVLEVRDLWPESLTGVSGRSSVLSLLLRVVADGLYRTSRAIVILAEGNRAPIVCHGGRPARIVFVPNGVSLETFEASRDELPDSLSWVDHHPTFVYAGAHGPANGLDLVLDAAQILQNDGADDIRLLLVGDGPTKEDLLRRATDLGLDNVVFHDPVSKQVIPPLLRRCTGGLMVLKDVELFRHGVSPNKLFDYLACDLPVVTNVPGDVATIVERSEAGVIVRPEDPAALAAAIRQVAEDGSKFARGSAYIRGHHDRGLLADRLAHVIDAVAR